MPTYEYECISCSHNFEAFQAMSDSPLKDCPKCGREVRRIIFGGSGVIFKGSGFYVTDKNSCAGKKEIRDAGTKPESTGDASKAPSSSPCCECPKRSVSPEGVSSCSA